MASRNITTANENLLNKLIAKARFLSQNWDNGFDNLIKIGSYIYAIYMHSVAYDRTGLEVIPGWTFAYEKSTNQSFTFAMR